MQLHRIWPAESTEDGPAPPNFRKPRTSATERVIAKHGNISLAPGMEKSKSTPPADGKGGGGFGLFSFFNSTKAASSRPYPSQAYQLGE